MTTPTDQIIEAIGNAALDAPLPEPNPSGNTFRELLGFALIREWDDEEKANAAIRAFVPLLGRAALSAAYAALDVLGWQVVPEEQSPWMITAVMRAIGPQAGGLELGLRAVNAHTAMLAATPQPPGAA